MSCNGEDPHINDVPKKFTTLFLILMIWFLKPDENECSVGGVEDNVAGNNDNGDTDHTILVIFCV